MFLYGIYLYSPLDVLMSKLTSYIETTKSTSYLSTLEAKVSHKWDKWKLYFVLFQCITHISRKTSMEEMSLCLA